MEKTAIIAKLKCSNVSIFLNEKIKNDYMIDNCVNTQNTDLKTKENSLLLDLLENENSLNYIDYYGNKITNCNFSKIKEFQ